MVPTDTRRSALKKIGGVVGGAGVAITAGCLGDDEPEEADDAATDDPATDGADDTDEPQQYDLTLAGGASGSINWEHGQMYQALVREHTDNVSISVQETAGTEANLRLYDQGEGIDILGLNNHAYNQALIGGEPYEDPPVENLPLQGHLFAVAHFYFLARDGTGIETYGDMAGRDVWPLWPGAGGRIITNMVLEELGLWEEINVLDVSTDDIAGALEEERVEAMAAYGVSYEAIPGWAQQVDARADLHALEMEAEYEEQVRAMPVPDFESIEPYGWEQDLGRDELQSFNLNYHIAYGEETPAEPVKELILALHEHAAQAQDIAGSAPDYSDASVLTQAVMPDLIDEIPVHPGAEEAFRELGVWDDDWD